MLESFAVWIIAVECSAMERLRHAGRIARPIVVKIRLAAPSRPASAASEHRRELDGWRQWRNRARVLVPRPGRTSTYVESGTCEAVQTNLVNMSATRVEPVVRRHLSDGCNRCTADKRLSNKAGVGVCRNGARVTCFDPSMARVGLRGNWGARHGLDDGRRERLGRGARRYRRPGRIPQSPRRASWLKWRGTGSW